MVSPIGSTWTLSPSSLTHWTWPREPLPFPVSLTTSRPTVRREVVSEEFFLADMLSRERSERRKFWAGSSVTVRIFVSWQRYAPP